MKGTTLCQSLPGEVKLIEREGPSFDAARLFPHGQGDLLFPAGEPPLIHAPCAQGVLAQVQLPGKNRRSLPPFAIVEGDLECPEIRSHGFGLDLESSAAVIV